MIDVRHADFVEAIRENMRSIASSLNPKMTVHVDDEQNFVKMGEISRNAVYIAVHFNEATVNFATSVCPVTLTALGTEDCVKPTQDLLFRFANKYNNTILTVGGNSVTQLWRSPVVVSNFIETGSDFRSLFSMSGTLIIGSNIVDVKELVFNYTQDGNEENEPIEFLSFSDSLNNQLEPQAFLDSDGFTRSEAKFSTYTFSFNTYLLNTKLIETVMRLKGFVKDGETRNNTIGNNTLFDFTITWSNGMRNLNRKFKLVSCQDGKNIGDVPTVTLTFTY